MPKKKRTQNLFERFTGRSKLSRSSVLDQNAFKLKNWAKRNVLEVQAITHCRLDSRTKIDGTYRDVFSNKLTKWWGTQNAVPLKFNPKASEAAFSAVFRTTINADRK